MKEFKGDDPARLWERYIIAECKQLSGLCLSDVRKNWEAPKVPGSHVSVEPSAPDFGGCAFVNCIGRSILFEAKYTEIDHRLPLANISDDQKDDLILRAYLGGISFIYVCNSKYDKFIIPINDLDNAVFPVDEKYLSPRKGSLLLLDECKKQPRESWLDFVVRNTDLEGRWTI